MHFNTGLLDSNYCYINVCVILLMQLIKVELGSYSKSNTIHKFFICIIIFCVNNLNLQSREQQGKVHLLK